MPETNVLQFRLRSEARPALKSAEAAAYARAYLEASPGDDASEAVGPLADADVLLSLCNLLRDEADSAPTQVAEKAARLHSWISKTHPAVGFFDERDFFLGETALTAGNACRLLGRREETERWLDRADASFRHTLNAATNLARVAYARLSLRFEMRRYDDVLELLPSVALTFEKLGMVRELARCRFLEAMALKDLGRNDEAMAKLQVLVGNQEFCGEDAVRGMSLYNVGDLYGQASQFDLALHAYTEALPLLQRARRFIALADLKGMVADTLHRMGRVDESLESYREAVRDYAELGVRTRNAYMRIVLADALLGAGRVKEAEWEIRAALPIITQENMVPEGFAALGVLGEAVRQRKSDPKALVELRQYLQANN